MPVAGTVPMSAPPALAEPRAQLLLRALADPIRLRVIEALADGERCVCELTASLELAQSRLSFHLRVMREAGLISGRQQGRWMYYRLEPDALPLLRDWLAGLASRCSTPSAQIRAAVGAGTADTPCGPPPAAALAPAAAAVRSRAGKGADRPSADRARRGKAPG